MELIVSKVACMYVDGSVKMLFYVMKAVILLFINFYKMFEEADRDMGL
jgi:hypothetical protein